MRRLPRPAVWIGVWTTLLTLGLLLFGVSNARTRLSGAPAYDVMDAQQVGAITAAPSPTTAAGDSIGGPFGAASTTRLGICVEDTTATLAASEITTRIGGALSELGSPMFGSPQINLGRAQ